VIAAIGGWRPWEAASAVYFVYIAAAAFAVRGLPHDRRARCLWLSAAGLALTCVGAVLPAGTIAITWLVPPLLLVIGYWSSGVLFVAPMPRVERVMASVDRELAIRTISARVPRGIAELLEVSYAAVYALVPIGLALCLRGSSAQPAAADRFWTVVLLTDFVCFGALPWIQTRPPRGLEPGEPWEARFRAVNLRLLAASIRVNTFPSGHAAEALALALLVFDVSRGPDAWAMLFGAAAVSAGAVFGRYHYALDALAGWLVAVSVWHLV
jgi:membrane-associated phospholipid phosphatase